MSVPPGAETVLLRYGDASTKSDRVQRRMRATLAENLEALLADRGIEATVESRHVRPMVHATPGTVDAACDAAADAMGVVSASPALVVDPTRAAIEDALARTARACYGGSGEGGEGGDESGNGNQEGEREAERTEAGTFAVRARRATDATPFDSEDVGRFGGSAVAAAAAEAGRDPAVDLDDPDRAFFVEIREREAFVFTEKRPGPGGLPLGSQDRLVALISGGIDSPVAAYEVMRRGSPVVPVYLELGPYGGPDHEARAMQTVARLADYAPNFDYRAYRVPAGPAMADLAERMDRGRMLAFRRFAFVVAAELADRTGAAGIVTGEALGQKSSQTARNLRVTAAATDLPVHRPLLAWDKQVIAERAREIGTFGDSTVPAGCERFAPPRPETGGRLEALREAEPDDLPERARAAVADADLVAPTGVGVD
jgi:thiamine biosynthesis protein ThiI